jgi:hypothetical protein
MGQRLGLLPEGLLICLAIALSRALGIVSSEVGEHCRARLKLTSSRSHV